MQFKYFCLATVFEITDGGVSTRLYASVRFSGIHCTILLLHIMCRCESLQTIRYVQGGGRGEGRVPFNNALLHMVTFSFSSNTRSS